MNIAFFDNGNLSVLYGKVSNFLNEKGNNSYLITLSNRKKEFLYRNNIKNVIYLNIKKGNIKRGEEIIKLMEKEIPEFRLYRAIELDRVLRYRENEKVRNFLFQFTDIMFDFLEKNKTNFFFGEITWAIEYITYFIMEYRKKYYYNLMNNYIVPGRFAFFDYKNSKNFIKKDFTEKDLKKAEEIYLNRMKVDINKSAKFLQTYIPVNLKSRLLNLLGSYSSEDYRYTFSLKKKILKKYVNRIFIEKLFKDFKDISFLEENKSKYKFAVLNLHIQPEATPDVVATYYNDQIRLINVIRASLPENYILLVKEHPNGIGSRKMSQLKAIAEFPGVMLINPKILMKDLFNYIDIVFSIAGTVAFESSLYGIPSIIFSDVFLEIFPLVYKVKNFDDLPFLIDKVLSMSKNTEFIKKKNIEAIAKIYVNTFEGNIYDPLLNPNVYDKNNINNICTAIKEFIERN